MLLLVTLMLFACATQKPNSNGSGTNVPSTGDNFTTSGITPPVSANDTTATESEQYLLEVYSSSDEYGTAGTYTAVKQKFAVGETVELVATVNRGYNFEGWFVGKTCVSEELNYTFTTRAQNTMIEARYSNYTVGTFSYTDEYEKAGTYTELNNKKISVGEKVTVEATVNAGYNFEGWFINDVCVSEELAYTFKMKESTVSLEARWSSYTVTTECWSDEQGLAGSYTKMNHEKISIGEKVTVTAEVNKGYNFEGWCIDGELVTTDLEYTFTMKEKNVSLEAVYSYYTISTESWNDEGMAGTYTKMEYERISAGETVTLVATVNDGYNFEGWYIGDTCVCKDLTYTFEMEKSEKRIRAEYSYYTVYVESWDDYEGMAGTYTKMDYEKISSGETVTLVATVNNGYNFEGWYTTGDVCLCKDLTYEFVMEKKNWHILARYSEKDT